MEAPDERLVPAFRLVERLAYVIAPTSLVACVSVAVLVLPRNVPLGLAAGVASGFLTFLALDAVVTRVVIPRVYDRCMARPPSAPDAPAP